jgi:hypothetical protein
LIPTASAPQEEQPLQVPRTFLERTVQFLNESAQGCLAELVFNLGEVGISDWDDYQTTRVVAPAAMFRQTIHHGVCRNAKHISMIVCVWAAGENISPLHRHIAEFLTISRAPSNCLKVVAIS